MKNKLSINSIHISGFRGYNKEEIIELNGKSALIFGDNYAGKSSTIGAIEWCMFGDFRSVKIDKNTVGSELVNNHCSNALVKINFVDEDGKHITIERNKQRDKGKSKTSLTTDEGNSVSEDGAEIFKLTKLGIEDFIRSVYLHQEDIRDVITEDRTVRSEALDRLFGLEELRNISDSIRATSINQTITSISNTRDSIITSISARLAEANKGLHESKENVRKLGISIDKINMTYVNKIVKNSFDLIRENLPSNSSIKNKEAANYYDVDDIAKELHSLVSKVRRSMPENDELQRINNKLSELDTASGDLAAYRTKLTGAKNDISVFNKENGTQKTINAAKNK
ncbi:MAG TPA: AAA family ATPase, partial [archaeon]|nr:AAA family ATPase [archaeon]